MSVPEQKPNPFLNSGLFVNTADTWTPFKMSAEGFAGGGKTFTMCCVALGLWEAGGKTGNVLLMDTERSAKFIVPFFRKFGLIEGKNFFVTHSRSLQRWGQILELAEKNQGSVFMTDTVTHIYEEMMLQFERDNGRKVKYPQDALIIKPMWKEKFSTPFVQANNTHLLFTGRAAWEYTMERDEDTGKKTFEATGVKMRGDNELAYEPDVVVLMERAQKIDGGQVEVARHATILKDRSRIIDGKDFYFTMDVDGKHLTDADLQRRVWEVFEPVYRILSSGVEAAVETESDKKLGPLFVKGGGEAYYQQKLRAERMVEEIGALYSQWGVGGTGGLERSLRAILNMVVFNRRSTMSLVELSPDELGAGFEIMEHLVRFAAKHMEPIEKMFKGGQYDEINVFLAEEKDHYIADLEGMKQAPPEDDNIPEFKTPTEEKAIIGEATVKVGREDLGDLTGTAFGEKLAAAVEKREAEKKPNGNGEDIARDEIIKTLMAQTTTKQVDELMADFANDIASMSIENRQSINRVKKDVLKKLKQVGEGARA